MTDSSMPEAGQRFIEWIAERWPGDQRCPLCHAAEWRVSGPASLTSERADTSAGLAIYKRDHPMMILTCGNCAHVLLFNALHIGIELPEIPDVFR